MERTWFTFHCWLYNLCIVVYVTNKTWNLKLEMGILVHKKKYILDCISQSYCKAAKFSTQEIGFIFMIFNGWKLDNSSPQSL